MKHELHPPALFRTHNGPLDELAYRITAALELGERHSRQGVEAYREAGELLLKAKEAMPYGEWGAWVQKHVKRSDRHVRRWMALAKTGTSDTVSELEESWAIITGRDDDEPDPPPVAKSNKRQSASPSPAPSPTTPAASNSAAEERCVGGDVEAEDIPDSEELVKDVHRLDKYGKRAVMRTSNLRGVPLNHTFDAIRKISEIVEWLEDLIPKPEQVRPIRKAICRDCKSPIIWAVTTSGANIALEAEPGGGKYELNGGLALLVNVVWGETDQTHLYRSHIPCPNRRT